MQALRNLSFRSEDGVVEGSDRGQADEASHQFYPHPNDGGNAESKPLAERFRAFVKSQSFPCVGAKSAIGRDQMNIVVARDIRSAWDDLRIYAALLEFATAYRTNPKLFQTLVVLFEQPDVMTEAEFEEALW